MPRKRIADRDRFSIIQPSLDKCLVCGNPNVQWHECLPGTANRQKSIQYGLVVALCPEHHRLAHTDKILRRQLAILAQVTFEETYDEEFIDVFKKNYKL